MADEIVVREGLLDHHQSQIVEPQEVIEVIEGIGVVRIGHQMRLRTDGLAHRAHPCHIATRCDLDLHLLIAGQERGPHLLDQAIDRGLDPERDPRRDRVAGATDEASEGETLARGLEPPGAHLQRGLRHLVAAHVGLEDRVDLAGGPERPSEEPRREDARDRRPGGIEGLRGVVRQVVDHALAPDRRPIGIGELTEEDPPVRHLPGGDAEGLDQWQADLAEDDSIEAHQEARRTRQ